MRYPMLSNWVTIKDYRFGNVTVTNELTDKVYTIDRNLLTFLQMLDGKTDPYTMFYSRIYLNCSETQIRDMLCEFSASGIIRNSGFFEKSILSFLRTIYIPAKRQSDASLWKILNLLLWLFFFPVFIWGLSAFFANHEAMRFNQMSILGIAAGYFAGILLHECGHAVAALANGGSVYEMGISLKCLILPGAYAAIRTKDDCSTIRKVQVAAAGIEVNLMLSGAAFMLASCFPKTPDFCYAFAFINLMLAAENTMFFGGIDGCLIFSHIFGIDTVISGVAADMILTRGKRQKLMRCGCVGRAYLWSYALILFLQIMGFIFLLVCVLNITTWFI